MRLLIVCLFFSICIVQARKVREIKPDDLGDDYSDFTEQEVKNGGANHNLKVVTYSTIPPKLDIPTRAPMVKPANNMMLKQGQAQPAVTQKPFEYRRGYYFQHYPWDRLPRRYLLRPGMTYVYPLQYQYANYRYPGLPAGYTDPYNIYRSHPGIGYGCGGGGGAGCGGGGYAGSYGSGCGGGSNGGGCGGGGYDDDDDASYEDDDEENDDEESGRSGEAKINKKDPLEDLELEDLEKISKSSDDSDSLKDVESKLEKNKESDDEGDEDLIIDRKKKKSNFLIKWA